MANRSLSAGGKLFLAGEYAVLWGGEARVACVGPRAHAVVKLQETRRVDIVIEAGRLQGDLTPLGIRWQEPVTAPFAFVAGAFDLAARAAGAEGPGFAVAFSPSERSGGAKLGLGSSARATVLASEAARWALNSDFDALKLALVAHAEAQGGRGSGGDVCACFVGELLRLKRYDIKGLLGASRKPGFIGALRKAPPVEAARFSARRLELGYVFTGQSASTTALVREVEGRLTEKARQRFVEVSDALGQGLERAIQGGDMALARETCTGLQAHLDSLGLPTTEALGRIRAMAEAYGCGAKQSGAGGGDGAIILAPTPEARAELLEALGARGFHVFPVTIEGSLRGEAEPPPQLEAWLAALPD